MPLDDNDKQWIKAELAEQLEALETKLLTAFQKWASPVEIRQRSHTAALRALELEMVDIQDRVKNLEHPPTS